MINDLCEVRIPTYKRPFLLNRALKSLVAQDHRHWKAIVMDDSPEREAEDVVKSFDDNRIIYTPNQKNLGAAGNLDQAFASHALLRGKYACILEDDNWFKPTFISANINALEENGVDLVLCNQEIWYQTPNGDSNTERTTRGDWLFEKKYTPLQLHAHLLYFETISNGGLFWRTSLRSNLQVGKQVSDAGLQEYCRAFQIQDSLYYKSEPQCCWWDVPVDQTSRNPINNRLFGRALQTIKRYLIFKYGQELIHEAKNIALNLNKNVELELSLIDALFLAYNFQYANKLKLATQYFKSWGRFNLITDPLQDYLR